MMWCANRTLLPRRTASKWYRLHTYRCADFFNHQYCRSRDDKLCGAGRNNLAVQSSSHFCVDLAFVLPRYAANRLCKHVCLQTAVHACITVSLNDPNSSSGNGNPCNMRINFVGSRCTACIYASVLLRSRGNAVRVDAGQDIPCFSHSSGHESRISRS